MGHGRQRLVVAVTTAMLGVALMPALPAAAASQTFTVTTTADGADGTCDTDCSLREAITAANANAGHDTVVLASGTYALTLADTDEDGNADGDLDITDDVTIAGAGAGTTTIDAGGDLDGEADGDHRVLEVATDAALGLRGLTLAGGDIPSGDPDGSDGGAILLSDSAVLSLDEVTVAGNRATSDGGGVDAEDDEGAIIRIENSTFRDNEAGGGDGGGLVVGEGTLTVRNSTFEANIASGDGGAITLHNEATGRVWDTTFVDNEADDGGGVAVGVSSYGSLLQCWDCAFTGNAAASEGGGIFAYDYENLVELHDTSFEGNTAVDDGGGMYLEDSTLLAERITFDGNTSESEGGGLWIDGASATIESATFDDNQAYEHGGGIGGYEMSLVVRNSTFTGNEAFDPTAPADDTTGGAISNDDDYGEMLIENVRFEGNSATEGGGALYLYETSVIIRDSEFVDNTVSDRGEADDVGGGAISEENESRLVIERTLFEGNTATGGQDAFGGAIFREEGPTTIIDSTFRDNTATTSYTTDDLYTARGGALYVEDEATPYEVRGTLFAGNAATGPAGATGLGGAISADETGVAVVTNSTFSANDALTAGGAFYGEDSGRLRAQSSTFVGNTAGDGNAIFLAADTGSGAGQGDVKGSLLQDHDADACAGEPVTSNGWNIVDDATCDLDESSDQDGTSAAYAALADNGGPTMTHALPASSLAIDAGADDCTDVAGTFAVTTDQRGAGRPVDGDADGDTACDVGAFEYQEAVTVVASDATADEDPDDGDDGRGEFTFSRPGTDGALEVVYTRGGSATAGDDYTALSGTVVIPDGQAATTVPVAPVADGVTEGPETVVVTLEDDVDYVVGSPSTATVTIADTVEVADSGRFAGGTRIETALAVSNSSFGDGEAGAVVLTRSDLFPDALAGTPLAMATDAPVLLTPPSELLGSVEDEIQRVLPAGGTVYLLGGPVALSSAVEDRLDALGFDTRRIAGGDRIDTSIAIADELGDPDTLLLTTGYNFPDALSAGAAATQVGGAVILTTSESPHATTTAYLDSRPGATVYAIGGPAARAYPDAQGIVGADRVATSVGVAEEFFDAPPVAGLAVSSNFPDALAGGVHAARNGGPLLLTGTTSVVPAVQSYLCTNAGSLESVYVYGGTLVLSGEVFEQAWNHINGTGC